MNSIIVPKKMVEERYFTLKIKKKFYGENIDKYLKEHKEYASRADVVREILRQYFKNRPL